MLITKINIMHNSYDPIATSLKKNHTHTHTPGEDPVIMWVSYKSCNPPHTILKEDDDNGGVA